MPKIDEATLRKAASWQDFKEAQGLLNTGAVQDSEETKDGWKGGVRVGKRLFRATVTARTATWLDAQCGCPANQREGRFCAHAIATGLHLLNPPPAAASPQKTPEPRPTPPRVEPASSIPAIPAIPWKIRFQGPWQSTLEKGRLSIALTTSDHDPTPSDQRLTSWLLDQKVNSGASIQLSLDPTLIPSFLQAIRHHPHTAAGDSALHIDSGIQLHLEDCLLHDTNIRMIPSSTSLVKLGESYWKIETNGLSRIGADKPNSQVREIISQLASDKPCEIPVETFPDPP